jgi:hypothetical protein
MKNFFFLMLSFFYLTCCLTQRKGRIKDIDLVGLYKPKGATKKLNLSADGTYVLYNPDVEFSPVIEQCEYASRGKWSVVATNLIEITSEEYYINQEGFIHQLKKENRFSQDSLYIQVIFPTDFRPVRLTFGFNYNNSKSVTTENTYISILKSKHLWNRKISSNHIALILNANVSDITLYKSRIMFKIFDEYIDTEKYNYLTITLPNFDRCFFEFEPYEQEFIFVKNKDNLLWQGESWEK